jgi:hypothetical protein
MPSFDFDEIASVRVRSADGKPRDYEILKVGVKYPEVADLHFHWRYSANLQTLSSSSLKQSKHTLMKLARSINM